MPFPKNIIFINKKINLTIPIPKFKYLNTTEFRDTIYNLWKKVMISHYSYSPKSSKNILIPYMWGFII